MAPPLGDLMSGVADPTDRCAPNGGMSAPNNLGAAAVSPLTMMVVLPLIGSLSIAVHAFVTAWVCSVAASLLFHFIL